MRTLAYNRVWVVLAEAGRRQGEPADRVGFVDELKWLSPPAGGVGGGPGPGRAATPVAAGRNYPYLIRTG